MQKQTVNISQHPEMIVQSKSQRVANTSVIPTHSAICKKCWGRLLLWITPFLQELQAVCWSSTDVSARPSAGRLIPIHRENKQRRWWKPKHGLGFSERTHQINRIGQGNFVRIVFLNPVCVKIVLSQLSAPCSSWLDSASWMTNMWSCGSILIFISGEHVTRKVLLSTSHCTVAAWVCFFHDWVLNMKAKRIMGHTTKSNTTRFHTSSHQWKGVSRQIASSHWRMPRYQNHRCQSNGQPHKGDVWKSAKLHITSIYNISSTSMY